MAQTSVDSRPAVLAQSQGQSSRLRQGWLADPRHCLWLLLALAGVFEMGWPVGFKLTEQPAFRVLGWVVAVACMALSGWLLWLAQKQIPIGTAYAVWTGIGGAGTFLIGVLFFGDALTVWRTVGAALIVGGVITLKLAN